MNKIFEKHETLFCILLIIAYIVINSFCINNFGQASLEGAVINTAFSICLVALMVALKSTTYSKGSAKFITVDQNSNKANPLASASFTFTGTGFDLFTVTDNKAGHFKKRCGRAYAHSCGRNSFSI